MVAGAKVRRDDIIVIGIPGGPPVAPSPASSMEFGPPAPSPRLIGQPGIGVPRLFFSGYFRAHEAQSSLQPWSQTPEMRGCRNARMIVGPKLPASATTA